MKKLQVRLYRDAETLFGKVAYMDEKLRGRLDFTKVINGEEYWIESAGQPALEENLLNVWGSMCEHDNDWFEWSYDDEKDAIIAARAFKTLIEDINNETDSDITVERII